MANLHDQAQAIWRTLDKMSEEDPDAYKKFIDEQLNNSKEFFKAQQQNSGGDSGDMFSQIAGMMGMGNMNMAMGPPKPGKSNVKNVSDPPAKKIEKKTAPAAEKSTTDLTDGAFKMNSLLASICPQDDIEDEEEILKNIKIPGLSLDVVDGNEKGTEPPKKRLIEEL